MEKLILIKKKKEKADNLNFYQISIFYIGVLVLNAHGS